jgi:hemoglobin
MTPSLRYAAIYCRACKRIRGWPDSWQNRGEDGVRREKQLLIDFLCASAGGPLYYTGRDMKTSHKGMKISEADWAAFLGHLNATLSAFKVPQAERAEVVAFVESTKRDIVEA